MTEEESVGPLLGKGGYGSVYALVNSSSGKLCRKALKLSVCRDEEELEAYLKEVKYLEMLHKGKLDLVPKLYSAQVTMDPKTGEMVGRQVMEQLDGNMSVLGLEQAARFGLRSCFLFTAQQLKGMRELQRALDKQKIVHGDFKPRNIVYRENGAVQKLIDFAFAGHAEFFDNTGRTTDFFHQPQIGYPDLTYADSANRKNPKNPPNFPRHLWRYLNRYQLFFSLAVNRKTYLWITPQSKSGSPCLFLDADGLREFLEIPRQVLSDFFSLFQKNHRPPPLDKKKQNLKKRKKR